MPVHIYVSHPLYKLDYKLELGHSILFVGKAFYVVSTYMFLHKLCYNFRLTCIYVCQHLWCRYLYLSPSHFSCGLWQLTCACKPYFILGRDLHILFTLYACFFSGV